MPKNLLAESGPNYFLWSFFEDYKDAFKFHWKNSKMLPIILWQTELCVRLTYKIKTINCGKLWKCLKLHAMFANVLPYRSHAIFHFYVGLHGTQKVRSCLNKYHICKSISSIFYIFSLCHMQPFNLFVYFLFKFFYRIYF